MDNKARNEFERNIAYKGLKEYGSVSMIDSIKVKLKGVYGFLIENLVALTLFSISLVMGLR